MLMLAEGGDIWTELVKQAPATAAVVLLAIAFLSYLSKLNERMSKEAETRAQREERLEQQRSTTLREMATACHENHRLVAAESKAAINSLAGTITENTRAMGVNTEALRGVGKKAS